MLTTYRWFVTPKIGEGGALVFGLIALVILLSLAAIALIAVVRVRSRRQRRLVESLTGAHQSTIEAMVRLEAVSELKSDFIKTVSHELRTPLTVLGGYTDMMADGSLGAVPEAWTKPLDKVQLKVKELNRLVQMMLEASRAESPQVTLNLETVDVNAVLEHAVAAQEPEADQVGCELHLDAPGVPVTLRCDRDKVLVSLRNLVENAVKYSPSGSTVDIGLHDDGGAVKISVADRGPGVPEGDKRRIFEQFYRLERPETKGVGGTGLGLFIVRRLSEAQGGRVSVADRPGGGSIFTLSLPRTPRVAA